MRILRSRDFRRWLEELPAALQTRIDERIDRLSLGHPGDWRSLGAGIFELKWMSGMRVYFSRMTLGEEEVIVLWLGGFKDTQATDIGKARRLKERWYDA